jgi:phage terminase large subunit
VNNWGEIINGVKHFPCHEGQLAILRSYARFTAAICGSGGGKSSGGALWLAMQVQKKPQGTFLIIVPRYKVLHSATMPCWINTVEGTDLEGEFKETRMEYRCPSGAKIFCRSADDPNSFEGVQADGIWIDEGGQISIAAWHSAMRRLGSKKGNCLITTTPYANNWLYKDFYAKWRAGDKNYFVVQFPSTANPTYSQEELERAKSSLPPWKFAMFHLGQFAQPEGLVYGGLDSCLVDRPEEFPKGRLVGGLDFGFNDPLAALAGVVDHDDVLWVFFERYQRNQVLDQHAAFLPKTVLWWCDGARPDSIKDLRRMGFSCKPSRRVPGSIEYGIELVQARIANKTLKIVRGTVSALFEEAELYRYPDHDEEVFGDVPVDDNNHACDALRYLCLGIDRRKVRKLATQTINSNYES